MTHYPARRELRRRPRRETRRRERQEELLVIRRKWLRTLGRWLAKFVSDIAVGLVALVLATAIGLAIFPVAEPAPTTAPPAIVEVAA